MLLSDDSFDVRNISDQRDLPLCKSRTVTVPFTPAHLPYITPLPTWAAEVAYPSSIMRLLYIHNLELKEFFEPSIPPYAILSHTWGSDEVTLQDLLEILICLRDGGHHPLEATAGFHKIKQSSKQAEQDGLEWVWVDTCCIDKTSSAELSEAINSMFRWYQNSAVCYAYLSDVEDKEAPEVAGSSFRRCRWFTRGWTLQELLAPEKVIFFSTSWLIIGDLRSLYEIVEDITLISSEFLLGRSVMQASISQKMAWASGRMTTRLEDLSYCLLGIFNVNMPLLYGEGEKAFLRLQHQIIDSSDDQTLFAWGFRLDPTESPAPPSKQPKLLATSPSDFRGCENIVQCEAWAPKRISSFKMTKAGLRIELPLVLCYENPGYNDHRQPLALLSCRLSYDLDNLIAIPLGHPSSARQRKFVAGASLSEASSADSIISSKADFVVQRYPQYSARLMPVSSLSVASHVPLSIISTEPLQEDERYQDVEVLTGLYIECLPTMLRQGGGLSACRQLAGDSSIDFSQFATLPVMQEVFPADNEACDLLQTTNSAYFVCYYKASQVLVRVDFLPPRQRYQVLSRVFLWPYNNTILYKFLPTYFFRLQRPIRCHFASISGTTAMDESFNNDTSYLQQLQWHKTLILEGGVSVYWETRRKRLMGRLMRVITLKTEGPRGRARGEIDGPDGDVMVSHVALPLWAHTKMKNQYMPTTICIVLIGLLIAHFVTPWEQLGTIVTGATIATGYFAIMFYLWGISLRPISFVYFNIFFFTLFAIIYYVKGSRS